MAAALIPAWTDVNKPVIGMLHLPPLPGSPRFTGDSRALADFVLRDADTLAAGGVHGLMLENFGDVPFSARRVPAYVVAQMTRIAVELRRRFDLPLGVNVLRNDGRGALAVAAAAGAEFIRVNVLCGARLTDQGIIQGEAYHLLRERALLRAEHIKILADVNVKHSAPLGPPRPLAEEVADILERGGADGLVVSGAGTGRPVDQDELKQIKATAGSRPVFIGSGLTAETLADCSANADGFIVGTSLKRDGLVSNPVEAARVAEFMRQLV